MATLKVVLTDFLKPLRGDRHTAPLPLQMVKDITTGTYLGDDHMNKFGQILSSKTDFRPRDVLLIQLLDAIEPVSPTSPHIQLLSGTIKQVGEITHWICTFYDGAVIHVYDSLNNRYLSPVQHEFLRRLFPHN